VSVWAWFVLECYAYHRPLRAVARALATMGVAMSARTLFDGAVITVFDGRRSPTGTMGT